MGSVPRTSAVQVTFSFTLGRGGEQLMLRISGGSTPRTTVTVVESLPSPPSLLAVSDTVYRSARLKLGLYVVPEPLLGEPPAALHEYLAISPPLLLDTRHVTLSPSSIEDREQLMRISGGSMTSTVVGVARFSLPLELRTVKVTVYRPSRLKRGRYVVFELLLGEPPLALHEYSVHRPREDCAAHVTVSPTLGRDGEQLISGGGTGRTSTVVESLPSPPSLLAVSMTVYRPSRLKLGLYLELEPLLGEPPAALHEYLAISPPLLLDTRHVTLSPSSIEDGEQLMPPLICGGGTLLMVTVAVSLAER